MFKGVLISVNAEFYKAEPSIRASKSDKRMLMHFSAFVHTHSFSPVSTQSFIHLAPGVVFRSIASCVFC